MIAAHRRDDDPAGRATDPPGNAAGPVRPVDLRLLPAAATAWAVAWAAVHSSSAISAALGALLGISGLALLGVLVLLRHLMPRGRRSSAPAVQLAVCCVAGAAVALSCSGAQRQIDLSGWPTTVSEDIPVQVQLEPTGPARETVRPGPDGTVRVIVPVTVRAYAQRPRGPSSASPPDSASPSGSGAARSGEEEPTWRQVDAAAVVLLTEAEAAGLNRDHADRAVRFEGMVRSTPADSGGRSTALLTPFGEGALVPVADAPAQVGGIAARAAETWEGWRSDVRRGTIELSSQTVGDGPELLPGLILGDRSVQSRELSEAMQVAGMTHLTVVSGTHCALVMGALLALLRLLRVPRGPGLVLALAGLMLYVGLVDQAPSVVRAAVMGALGALSLFAGRRRVSFSLLCVCVLGMLIWDPWYAVDAAMQLSAAATAGIVLTGARIQEAFARVLPGVVAGPLALAVSAQLFVTPLLLPLAGGVTTYTVLANVLAAPLLPLATVPGLLGALLAPALPPVAGGLLGLCALPAAAIGWIGRTAAGLPRALAAWPEGLTGTVLVCLYVVTVLLLARRLMAGGREAGGAGGAGSAQDGGRVGDASRGGVAALRRTGALVWLSAALLGSLAAMVLPAPLEGLTVPPEDWTAAMCDVGQGDMLVVRTGPTAAAVVDAGEDPEAADRCLSSLGVGTVDMLFVTHEHRDHYGGVPGVVRGRDVGEVLHGGTADWAPHHESELAEALGEVPVRRAEQGVVGHSGGADDVAEVQWQVWLAHQHHPEPNDNSLVVLFELQDPHAEPQAPGGSQDPLRLLATGDLEEDAARLAVLTGAMPEHVDVIKVAHHGAANGGTETIEHTSPRVALIGVGQDNTYGHPAPSILQALRTEGAAVYRTDLHGGVVLTLRGGALHADALAARW
ncbi:ComEC/Rec2 family competence protein [Nesterenkonia sp. K-15-9-6]|uniref:ComEC/Rec2 family competence protein n=1 Tax=Nesterenkonia sp. K-15-9-6 TaxID=3093918 RepID=UPI00404470F7